MSNGKEADIFQPLTADVLAATIQDALHQPKESRQGIAANDSLARHLYTIFHTSLPALKVISNGQAEDVLQTAIHRILDPRRLSQFTFAKADVRKTFDEAFNAWAKKALFNTANSFNRQQRRQAALEAEATQDKKTPTHHMRDILVTLEPEIMQVLQTRQQGDVRKDVDISIYTMLQNGFSTRQIMDQLNSSAMIVSKSRISHIIITIEQQVLKPKGFIRITSSMADQLGISPRTLRKALQRGDLDAAKIPGGWYYYSTPAFWEEFKRKFGAEARAEGNRLVDQTLLKAGYQRITDVLTEKEYFDLFYFPPRPDILKKGIDNNLYIRSADVASFILPKRVVHAPDELVPVSQIARYGSETAAIRKAVRNGKFGKIEKGRVKITPAQLEAFRAARNTESLSQTTLRRTPAETLEE